MASGGQTGGPGINQNLLTFSYGLMETIRFEVKDTKELEMKNI